MAVEDVVFIIYPEEDPLRPDDDYREFLWTPSALTLRKYIKVTEIDMKRVHKMTNSVFKKFKESLINGEHGDSIEFLEIFDQGDYAAPDEFTEAVYDAASDIIFDLKAGIKVVLDDLSYLKDPDAIKLKKSLNKYLKKIEAIDSYNAYDGMASQFKYKKLLKEYYGERKDDK
jgi:hypothetical protein